MRVLGVILIALTFVSLATASQIVPVFVDTPGGFGPGAPLPTGCTVHFEVPYAQAIRCDIAVPATSVEIAGWGGYAVDLGVGPLLYMTTEVWHDGGTPHRLDQPTFFPPGGTITPPFYPSGDGHKSVAGDQVFARFWCVGFPGKSVPRCASSLVVHFRVNP